MAVPSYRIQDKSGWAIADPARVRQRVIISAIILAAIFMVLLARLWFLQVVQGPAMLVQAERNRLKNVPIPAPRGLILDRNGVVLATSRTTHSIALVPAALPSAKKEKEARLKIMKTLAFLVGQTPAEIEAQLDEAAAKGGGRYDPVRIGGDVDLETITQVEENRARLGPAVMITDNVARSYPNGKLAAHTLGYTGGVTAEELEKAKKSESEEARELRYDSVIGKIGLEKQYDHELSGKSGSDQYEADARGRPVRKRGTIAEKPGHTLVLTIDQKLQKAAETALDAASNSGAAAVIDVRNGEVLALASRPTFDPNAFSLPKKQFQPLWLGYNRNTKHPLINRAVSGRFPPASTFKIVTAAAGLERGTLHPGDSYVCKGGIKFGRFFGCWAVHGKVNLETALAGSCDVFFYEEAKALGNPESDGPTFLAQTARKFGMGSPTGIDLPIDKAGLVPDPAWRRAVNAARPAMARWFPGNTLNMSIGQGDLLATPLQNALLVGALANGGTLYRPHLMKELRDANSDKVIKRPEISGRSINIRQENLQIIREGLHAVMTKGTGKGLVIPNVDYAGKTGSAEDANHALPHAWFVAYAPYKNPRIAIAVIVENAGHGGENAGPVARAILQAAFPLPPKSSAPTATSRP